MRARAQQTDNIMAVGDKLKAVIEVFVSALKLGLTSFGGPVAHLGYFHDEYVRRRRWLVEESYAELVALCQLLPGPASSQFGIAVGTMRAGIPGGIVSWLGFTLPSALIMTCFALFMKGAGIDPDAGWLHGLKIVAVAIVAQAVIAMGQKLAPERVRATMALAAAALALLWRPAASQVAIITAAGIAGIFLFRDKVKGNGPGLKSGVGLRTGAICLAVFFVFLILFPLVRHATGNRWIAVADSFYRSGSLVFGGGHVILPLLEREVVPPAWVSAGEFLAGYGAAQALPGPLFTFTAYLGAMMGGAGGAALAIGVIFLPAYLLIIGALPFWGRLRGMPRVQGAVAGINAGVVGILVAALYLPLWTSSIKAPADFALAAILFGMLVFWKLPPWCAVIAGAAGGMLLTFL